MNILSGACVLILLLVLGWVGNVMVLRMKIDTLHDELAAAEQQRLEIELEAERVKALAERCSERVARLHQAQEATSKLAAEAQENARVQGETFRKRAAKVAATVQPKGIAECKAVAGLLEEYQQ